ncbi:hypothetical protein [Agromyces sp. H66]|uniref:hypothetical protein n=1 Tax=Agromyces sp. H66 TaxID=2529859 RepID=UPI0010AAF0D8|nr:hypothetical protein [Agromyces sp. H66]
MTEPGYDDPAAEDEEQWRERAVNDAVAGEHVPTDDELDLERLEHEGLHDEEEPPDDGLDEV